MDKGSAYWLTNLTIVGFIVTFAARQLLVAAENNLEVTSNYGGTKQDGSEFRQPLFQIMACYFGEFVFVILYYLYLGVTTQCGCSQTEIRFINFIYPAACDFTENLLFVFGLARVMPSMSMMTKALALPVAIALCKWLVRKTFNQRQWAAIFIIMAGALLATAIGVVENDIGVGSLSRDQVIGLIELTLSACI